MRPIVSSVAIERGLSVCLSVGHDRDGTSPAKTAAPIALPFRTWTPRAQGTTCYVRARIPPHANGPYSQLYSLGGSSHATSGSQCTVELVSRTVHELQATACVAIGVAR